MPRRKCYLVWFFMLFNLSELSREKLTHKLRSTPRTILAAIGENK
ncbi:hypothetical protein [Methylobacter svalbardensis]